MTDAMLRLRAGQSIRDIGHAVVGHEAAPELLERVASTLEQLTAQLVEGEPRFRDPATFGASVRKNLPATRADGEAIYSFDDRPISGRASPWGIDLDVQQHGDEIRAFVTLRAAHEGAPRRAHGGIVAALFDDVLGFVLGMVHVPAFTGELALRFEAATPLHRPLVCRARMTKLEGRKLYTTAELIDVESNDVLVTATATFITVDPALFDRVTAAHELPSDS